MVRILPLARSGRGFIVGAVLSAVLVGGVAVATIPHSGTNVYTACVAKTDGATRIIDAQAGQDCKKSERTVTWSKGWRHRGEWSAGTAYKAGDVVTRYGSSFVASAPSTGEAPGLPDNPWKLLAASGASPGQYTQAIGGTIGPLGGDDWWFLGNTAYLYPEEGQNITVSASGMLHSTWATDVELDVCYRGEGVSVVPFDSEHVTVSFADNSDRPVMLDATVTPSGSLDSYEVGFCYRPDNSDATFTGTVSGWAMLTLN
jgi:hypothetical protein